jgi:diol dehydratase reactivase alpha subunit
METIIGIDVGNSTTEAALARVENGECHFLCSAICKTTGTKGTAANIAGILRAIERLTASRPQDTAIDRILLNDATPVIADFAMDTVTETIITDSTMIGHNPDTPGGVGLGIGNTFLLGVDEPPKGPSVAVVSDAIPFARAAALINDYSEKGCPVRGAVVQADEGTLIHNRLKNKIPIVDEVKRIEKIPLGMHCAVEVAEAGYSIDTLSNPYGIASVFGLDARETDLCRHIARALIGNRSAVIIRTPMNDVKARTISAGTIEIIGRLIRASVDVDSGAAAIMKALSEVGLPEDVVGEPGTNIGGMMETIKTRMRNATGRPKQPIRISDLFAVDTQTAIAIPGSLADEYAMESSVAIAAMIRSDESTMLALARDLQARTGIPVNPGGVEGEAALIGALTTPGTSEPLAMIDIGAGSTDAAVIESGGHIESVHLAGAGNLITMLINSELNLKDFSKAEDIKKYPLARVENLHRLRYENGDVRFFEEPLSPDFYGQVVTVKENGALSVLDTDRPMDRIRAVRREAKRKVLNVNVLRALEMLQISPRQHKHIVLVGGSFLDFEASNFITEELAARKLTAGRGNIRGKEGPRNAVATGLIRRFAETRRR